MAEPENHTLRVLREFREEFADFRTETRESFANLGDRLDDLAKVLAGEMVTSRHTDASVDERLGNIERRLSVLEETK
ncbi:MAG TPA: hypothetical protein VF987_01325 [Rhodospirillales bacterium]|jgi:hypothetical protein